jgi:membrane protease YdiL (CAAX protease family)
MSGSLRWKFLLGQYGFCAVVLACVIAVQFWVGSPLSLYLSQTAIGLGVLCVLAVAPRIHNPVRGLFGPAQSRWGLVSAIAYAGASTLALISMPSDWRAAVFAGFGEVLTQPQGLVAIAVAPVIEEIYFRGALLGATFGLQWPRLGEPRAVASIYLVAAVFLLFHLPVDPAVWSLAWESKAVPVNLGPLALGLWTGIIVVKDRSLRWAIVAHSLANFSTPVWDMVFRKL